MSLRDFASFFRNSDEEAEIAARGRARAVIDWMGREYHKEFMKWLDDEASKPFDIDKDEMRLIKSAVRANTLREVRSHLLRLESLSLAALEDDGE